MTEALDLKKVFHYQPHHGTGGRPNQWDFHNARHKSTFRVMLTGKRGGKTTGGVAEDVYWALNYPGSVGWVGEPNYPMVERNLLPAYREILGVNSLTASSVVEFYDKQKHLLGYQNGSLQWLGSMDDPESVEGITLDYFHLDEGRLCKDFRLTWDTLTSRLSGTKRLPRTVKPQGWITSTPALIGSEMWDIIASESPNHIPGIQIFSWYLSDNPSLEDWYVRMMNATNKTESQRRAFLQGLWASGTIGTLPFDYAKHVFKDMSIVPDEGYIKAYVYGVDWGYTDPYVILCIIIDKYGRGYVVDEFYQSYFDVSKRTQKAKEMEENWGKGVWWCGHDEPGFIKGFRDKQLDARAYVGKVDETVENLAGWLMEGDDGVPRLRIWHECKATILELSQFVQGEKDQNDHAISGLRYALSGFDSHRPMKIAVVEKEHKGLKFGRKVDEAARVCKPVQRGMMNKPRIFNRR